MSKEDIAPNRSGATSRARDTSRDAGNASRSCIGQLIDRLLGDDEQNAGLSRFSEERLIAIQRGAEQQADECLCGLQAISHLLAIAASHPQAQLPNHVLFALAEHLHSQSLALERWNELAEHAAYCCD